MGWARYPSLLNDTRGSCAVAWLARCSSGFGGWRFGFALVTLEATRRRVSATTNARISLAAAMLRRALRQASLVCRHSNLFRAPTRSLRSSAPVAARILCADNVSPRCAEIFEDRGHKTVQSAGLSFEELKTELPKYDAVIVRSATKLPAEAFPYGTSLKVRQRLQKANAGTCELQVACMMQYHLWFGRQCCAALVKATGIDKRPRRGVVLPCLVYRTSDEVLCFPCDFIVC